MNRIFKVAKQMLAVALVAGIAAYFGAMAAIKITQAKPLPNPYQLVENPKPCAIGC